MSKYQFLLLYKSLAQGHKSGIFMRIKKSYRPPHQICLCAVCSSLNYKPMSLKWDGGHYYFIINGLIRIKSHNVQNEAKVNREFSLEN